MSFLKLQIPVSRNLYYYYYYFKICLFIFGCTGSWLLCAGLSPVAARGGYSCVIRASHGSGFFCCGTLALGMQASVVPVHGLSSCGAWA